MLRGRQFWKLTGSGNDFVFFDARDGAHTDLLVPEAIAALCDRRAGVGADGIVLFEPPVEPDELYSFRYFNRDGSLAEMCGNAALCSVRLAQLLGVLSASTAADFAFHSTSGRLRGRVATDEQDAAVSMPLPAETNPSSEIAQGYGEQRIGFTRVGVPHLVVLVTDIEAVDVAARGRALRMDRSLRDGANVNFIQRARPGRWTMRTYERGVEAETLACGSGAVAVATLVQAWQLEPQGAPVDVAARGGRTLGVSWSPSGAGPEPFLRGEGRLVFSGTLEEPFNS